MTASLVGRRAVITGAAGNLGPVWASALIDAGADVVGLTYPGTAVDPSLVRLAGCGRFVCIDCDVTSRSSLEQAANAVFGDDCAPDIVVANAGLDQPPKAMSAGNFAAVRAEDFEAILSVNLTGTFQTLQVFGPRMAALGRGSIVVIGSLYSIVSPDPALYDHLDPPFLKPPAYVASKAEAVQLVKYCAVLWGPSGVRVNALSPGGVRSSQDAHFIEKFSARVPLRRMAGPDDLRGPLVFLASDQSRYVTGINLQVDGGFCAL